MEPGRSGVRACPVRRWRQERLREAPKHRRLTWWLHSAFPAVLKINVCCAAAPPTPTPAHPHPHPTTPCPAISGREFSVHKLVNVDKRRATHQAALHQEGHQEGYGESTERHRGLHAQWQRQLVGSYRSSGSTSADCSAQLTPVPLTPSSPCQADLHKMGAPRRLATAEVDGSQSGPRTCKCMRLGTHEPTNLLEVADSVLQPWMGSNAPKSWTSSAE